MRAGKWILDGIGRARVHSIPDGADSKPIRPASSRKSARWPEI
jgi:hypothetical protein